jgi:molecular chaperone HscC
MIVGIDLGTTNSLAAAMTPDGPRLIPNALGEVLTPSVVAIDRDGQVLVGRAARELQVTQPQRCASAFKRYMGSDWACRLDGRQFGAVELSSLVLRTLRQDAERYRDGPVNRAVITVPAYFNEPQRKATIRAGQMAGFQVERILNEPTAAAIAYGAHERESEKVMLVYDLGGGTFDVSIVDLFEGALEIRASSGETFLGGEDFTNTLTARVLEARGYVFERAELDFPLMVSRLRRNCEAAKRLLSRAGEAVIRIPDERGDVSENAAAVTMTRQQFAEWTDHILARTALPIRRVLGDARLKREAIDDVILVGGATRMPAVIASVVQTFGREPRCSLNPDEVVALGAAVQAGLIARDRSLDDLVVTDVAPFTLGIETSRSIGGQHRGGYFLPVINRNTTIPVSRVERVSTLSPNQTQIHVRIYQGENRRVEGNAFLGEFLVDGIPRGPAGQPVDVRFTYDLNGVLEVEATIVETRARVSHLVTRFAKGLSQQEIDRAVAAMQELKMHPREDALNRFALRRAERLYQELPFVIRRELEDLISGFEEALELQDKQAIDANRSALEEFLDRYDREFDGEPDDERSW